MSNLSLKTRGVRGGNLQYNEKIGEVITFLRHGSDFIAIDDYEGSGKTYQKREGSPLITVYENGNLIFSGNKTDFFNQLKK